MTEYPRVQNSPGTPRDTILPISGSMTLTSTCGWTQPTVVTRFSRASSVFDWQETGEVSVIP